MSQIQLARAGANCTLLVRKRKMITTRKVVVNQKQTSTSTKPTSQSSCQSNCPLLFPSIHFELTRAQTKIPEQHNKINLRLNKFHSNPHQINQISLDLFTQSIKLRNTTFIMTTIHLSCAFFIVYMMLD